MREGTESRREVCRRASSGWRTFVGLPVKRRSSGWLDRYRLAVALVRSALAFSVAFPRAAGGRAQSVVRETDQALARGKVYCHFRPADCSRNVYKAFGGKARVAGVVLGMDAQIIHILHRIEGKLEEHDGRFDLIDCRLDSHDQKFVAFDQRLDSIDHRLDGIDHRLDGLDHRLDGIDQRLDGHDQEFEAVHHRLDDMHHFMIGEFNLVYGKLDGLEKGQRDLETGQRHLEVLFEDHKSTLRLVAEGFSGHTHRLDDHQTRIEFLESA